MQQRWAALGFAFLLAATTVPSVRADPPDPPRQPAPVRSAPADPPLSVPPAPGPPGLPAAPAPPPAPTPPGQSAPGPFVPIPSPAPAPPALALQIIVNDTDVPLPSTVEVRGGAVFAPLARVVMAFGGTASWDAQAHAVTVTGASGAAVRVSVGSTRATSGTVTWDLPAAPIIKDGSVWAPVAAVLRGVGAYVKEDPDAGIVDVVSQVTGITWRRAGGALAVRIAATGPVRAAGLALRNPDRVVVDLTSAVTRLQVPEGALQSEGVVRVRTAQFHVRPYVTRVVFDLVRPLAFTIGSTSAAAVVVALGGPLPAGGTAAGTAGAAPAESAAAPSGSAAPASGVGGPAPGSAIPGAGKPAAGSASPASGPAAPPTPGAPVPGSALPVGSDRLPVPVVVAPLQPANGSRQAVAPEPLALPPLPEFADRPGTFHVRGVTYDEQDGVGRVTVRASRPFKYTVRQFVYPDRLAIDVTGGVFVSRRQDLEIGSASVRNVVVSQLELKPNLTRVLVHLNHKTPYTALVTDGGRGVVVMLGDTARRLPRGTAVVIDPGHGGADGGAAGPSGLREADVALSIARMTREALVRQGMRVAMTRTDDSTVGLEDRPDFAQRYGGMVFVSIHANASTDPNANGTETYFKTSESRPLAALIESEVVQALGEPDRGVRNADFYVLVNTPMPSVLVETAFISNATEETLLRDPTAQRRIADAIARGIVKFLAAQRSPAP